MDLKEASRILGVKEGASKEEVLKRYDVILIKLRNNEIKNEINLEEISEAYNLLMGHSYKEEPREERYTDQVLKKAGIDSKKLNNFIYYYKYHVIIGILCIIAVVFFAKSMSSNVTPDVRLAVIGNIYIESPDVFKEQLKSKVQGLKDIQVTDIYISDEILENVQQNPGEMKATVSLAANEIDIMILDKKYFDKYSKQGILLNLDSLAGELGIDIEKNSNYIVNTSRDEVKHLYGIDITNSSIIKDAKLPKGEKIAAIKLEPENYQNAVTMLKALLK